jgi:hypothetical protein
MLWRCMTVSNRKDTPTDRDASAVELVARPSRGSNVFEGSRDSANKGMFVDPGQLPMTLMEPSMQAGQSAAPEAPMTVSDSAVPESGPGAG